MGFGIGRPKCNTIQHYEGELADGTKFRATTVGHSSKQAEALAQDIKDGIGRYAAEHPKEFPEVAKVGRRGLRRLFG